MKSTIKTAAWICAILLVSVSCYDDGTDCFDTATRISLYPDVELFNADGTTASGNESFVSAVPVNVGPAVSDMAWEASVPASAAWATVRRTTVASIFEEAAGGARHDLSADGIELVLQPNTEYRRTVVVTIAAADGTTADYEFTQLGQKADAAVTSEIAQLVFMAAGGSETVTYTSNMGDAYELTRKAAGEYTGTLYFLRSADGGNPVLLNKNGRTVSYPCYALTKEGTVAEIPTAETQLPAGPDIDIDGVRRFTVDFNAMTWSWERVTTPNCLPDTEVAAYPTKAYVTRDGGTKTWMTVGLHWAGDATIGRYKLGSGLVSGHQTGGYGNEAPYASRNPAYDTEENGGSIVEAKDGSGRPLAETYGRLYSSYESLTGSANGALNACEGGKNALINSPIGEPGSTLVDAVGDRYVLESIMPADLAVYAATAAGDAQAEAEHPNLKMQIQGICPYGWHIANMQDWKDLVWAAHAQGAADYPVDAATATYRAFGSGTLTNFAALLFTSDWNIYNPDCPAEKISTAAADFGFNMFSQGWRLYKTGYDYGPGDNDPRMYSFIPLIGDYSATKKAGWRIWNQSREANMRTNGGFDFGNGCGGAVRCVKNYKK